MAPRTRELAARWVELGLGLRVLAACAVQWLATRRGTRCLFPDTNIYWLLAQALRRGESYEVSQWGIPHFALRAPGYPAFLALLQAAFGDRTMPVRLAQALIGAGGIVVLARLVDRLAPAPGEANGPAPPRWATPALVAAALAAVDPYTVGFTVVLLSEALFLPLMLLGLWGLSALWPGRDQAPAPRFALAALGTGVAWGAAILTKPSWALFPPAALAAWVLASPRGRRRRAALGALVVALGLAAIMAPWWARNARLYGRFVPTALWTGASLYDGLNPRADGSSDMSFLDAPEWQPLDEEAQDARLTTRALDFARTHPRRALELAAIKAARYWSPWPNAETANAPPLRLAFALWVLPIYALVLRGAWDRRRDPRALVLLAGPVLYFAAIHMVFVSSIRYRVPGLVPAFGLAGIALSRLTRPPSLPSSG